ACRQLRAARLVRQSRPGDQAIGAVQNASGKSAVTPSLETARSALAVCLWLAAAPCAAAAEASFDFPAAAADDPAALASAMPSLARAVSIVYRDDDRAAYLDNMFRLQVVAGGNAEAIDSLEALRALRLKTDPSPQTRASNLQYEILAQARVRQAQEGVPI